MIHKSGHYVYHTPSNIPFHIQIPNTQWIECTNCGEVILPPELNNRLTSEISRNFSIFYTQLSLSVKKLIKELTDSGIYTSENDSPRITKIIHELEKTLVSNER